MHSDGPDLPVYKHIIRPLNVYSVRWGHLMGLLIFLLTLSCRQSTTVQQDGLYGKWDIHKAMRNGKETHYLRGGYFIIEPDGTMTVNITGTDERGSYLLDGNTLRLNNEKDFVVESQQNDSMAIRYIMNANSTFLFYLTKKADEKR